MSENLYLLLFLLSIVGFFITFIMLHYRLYKFYIINNLAENYSDFLLKSPLHFRQLINIFLKKNKENYEKNIIKIYLLGVIFLILIFVFLILWFGL